MSISSVDLVPPQSPLEPCHTSQTSQTLPLLYHQTMLNPIPQSLAVSENLRQSLRVLLFRAQGPPQWRHAQHQAFPS